MNATELLQQAKEARSRAYTPYSGFSVGAALLARDGRIFLGCNIENAAYSPTCCAERVAVFRAVSEGAREFAAIAIAGGHHDAPDAVCAPCGVCRQVLSEFCSADFRVLLGNVEEIRAYKLSELLPLSFSLIHGEGGDAQ